MRSTMMDTPLQVSRLLEHGRLTPQLAKRVVAEVNTLCKSLRPHARTLVDAFAIPEQLVTTPMGL